MNITVQIIIFFIAVLFSVVVGLYVFAQSKGSFMRKSFALLVFGLTCWGMSITALYLTHMFLFSSLVFMSGALWFVGLMFFTYSFPHDTPPPNSFLLRAIPASIIFLLAPFNVFITGFTVDVDGYLRPENNYYFLVPFMFVFASYVVCSIISVVRNYRLYSHDITYRTQFHYFFIGAGSFIGAVLLFDTILPAFGFYTFNLLGPASAVIFFGCTAYAILRHKLLDIRFVIQRGLIYTLLSVLIVSVYILLIQSLAYGLGESTALGPIVSGAVTTVLGVFFVRPIEEYFRKLTDPIFFKGSYNYAEALHMLSRVLYTTLKKEDIVEQSSELLRNIFKTDDVWFIFAPTTIPTLTAHDQMAGFPTLTSTIVFEDKVVGVLHLGQKRSGDTYTKQDHQLISTFTFQAAIAFGKAELYQQVAEYNTELEHLVEKRTSEIRLLQEDQRQTMIDISHNLQTPLAVIRGELELLSKADPHIDIYAMRKSLDRVSVFIRQLLHLARLEHSMYMAPLMPVDLAKLLKEQIDYFEVMAEDKGVRIYSDVVGPALIQGDKRLLEELFTNLVANAITYRRTDIESYVWITLAKINNAFEVTVRDNGVGIAPEDINDIFIRFHRISHTSHNLQGTGLGLAIAKKIVEKHNGKITVESVLGEGTLFRILFPAIHAH